MERIKENLFRLLAGKLSLEAFEQWLYTDEYVTNHILDNDAVLDLLSINFKEKDVMHDLEKYCEKWFDQDELITYAVYESCKTIVSQRDLKTIEKELATILNWHLWEEDRPLLERFYWLQMDLEEAIEGWGRYTKSEIQTFIIRFAEEVLRKRPRLDDTCELEEVHVDLIGSTNKTEEYSSRVKSQVNVKKWYLFWK